MSCEKIVTSVDKSRVVLNYTRSEIIYHIANDAYIQRQAANVGVDVSDLCADGNIDHVERVLRLTFNGIVELLYQATKASLSELPPASDGDGYELNEECDCVCDGEKVFSIEMQVGAMSATTINYLYDLIKEVLIGSVIADWLTIVAPDLATIWQSKVDAAQEEISSAINRRTRFTRITPHWL